MSMMTRKELAQSVFVLFKRVMPKKDSVQLWIAIAETDDATLRRDYEKLISKNYSLAEWQAYKDEEKEKEANKKK